MACETRFRVLRSGLLDKQMGETDKTTKEEELESSRCPSCDMRQEKAHHLNRCKNSSRRAVFERQIQVLKEWMSSSYTHLLLEKWLTTYLKGQGKSFQLFPNLPKAMRCIAEEQDAIGWTSFAEGRVTRQIRDMQTVYMGNLDATYTVDHWMKDFMRKLMGLSHDTWLARNMMKHHKTKDMISIRTKEELLREADKIAQQYSLSVEEKYSWLLDVESAAYAKMGCAKVQYSIF